MPAPSTAATFAALAVALLIAHQVADHWVQTSHQSAHKGQRGWAGSRACAAHVATYTLTTMLAVLITWVALDLPLTWAGVLAGQGLSAITHYWADRRYTLAGLAERLNLGGFHRLGTPRPGRDDNPTLGTGANALDQSWHWAWLGIAALVTTLI